MNKEKGIMNEIENRRNEFLKDYLNIDPNKKIPNDKPIPSLIKFEELIHKML